MSLNKIWKKEQEDTLKSGFNKKSFGGFLNKKTISNKIRKFGAFLAGMIMPAIGVFIAWGLLTAFFIPTGWIPNERLSAIVGPTIIYIIPALVAFFGGKQIYGIRGGLIGVVASMGIIIGGQSDYFRNLAHIVPDANGNLPGNSPMLLGAMIVGPLSALIFAKLEKIWQPKIPQGYEMLINNFSMGIFGFLFMVGVYWGVTPFIAWFQLGLTFLIDQMRLNNLNWLLPVFVEPAKVLFLNNAVNHGIFSPLGLAEISKNSRSFLLLLDPNPGQGLGILLAYYLFAKSNETRSQALSAMPIHFVGGIHEVYFPFVLMKPFLIVFMIIGGIFNVFVYEIFGVGSIGINSPGSVISVYTFIAKDSYLGLTIAVFGSTGIVFGLTSSYLILERKKNGEQVFVRPDLAWINGKYAKLMNRKSLSTKPFANNLQSLKYETIETNKKYKLEKIKYKNNSEMVYLLSLKYQQIKNFKYIDYNKKTYLIKVFTKNKLSWFNHLGVLLRKKLSAKKYNTFFNQVAINFDFKHDYLLWSKVSDEEKTNEVTSIDYAIENYKKKYRIYSYLNPKTKKVVHKKEQVNFNFYEENLKEIKSLNNTKQINVKTDFTNLDLEQKLQSTKQIVFACEAGMGSSVLGASIVRKILKDIGNNNIVVINKALKNLTADDTFVITQENFLNFVEKQNPNSYIYTIKQYLDKKGYEKLIQAAKKVFQK